MPRVRVGSLCGRATMRLQGQASSPPYRCLPPMPTRSTYCLPASARECCPGASAVKAASRASGMGGSSTMRSCMSRRLRPASSRTDLDRGQLEVQVPGPHGPTRPHGCELEPEFGKNPPEIRRPPAQLQHDPDLVRIRVARVRDGDGGEAIEEAADDSGVPARQLGEEPEPVDGYPPSCVEAIRRHSRCPVRHRREALCLSPDFATLMAKPRPPAEPRPRGLPSRGSGEAASGMRLIYRTPSLASPAAFPAGRPAESRVLRRDGDR